MLSSSSLCSLFALSTLLLSMDRLDELAVSVQIRKKCQALFLLTQKVTIIMTILMKRYIILGVIT